MPKHVDTELLRAALAGFEQRRTEIDQKMAELRQMIDGAGRAAAPVPALAKHKKRTISAAGRRRIALAQKKRWAASQAGGKAKKTSAATQPKKRVISAAGRARIAVATKKRWAAWRKAQKA
jgi:choline dehydrogenase-like flavoprotein